MSSIGAAISRRRMMARTVLGGTAAALAMPALAQQQPGEPAKLKIATAFDKARDAIRLPMRELASTVAALTDGKLTVEFVEDAGRGADLVAKVARGELDACHVAAQSTLATYPALALGGGAPFGLNARLLSAWLHDRQGLQLLATACAADGIVPIPAGATGAQMGGWFRREVTDAAGFKGLKVAADGFAAQVLSAIGAQPVALTTDAIAPALTAGTIDGAIWGLPYDDENLRLYQAAKVLHYPGWWDGAGQMFLVVNKARMDALAKPHAAALRAAAAVADRAILARYDAQNPAALRRAVASGASLAPLPEALLDTCFSAAATVTANLVKDKPALKEIHASQLEMRRDGYLWQQLAETTFDTYLMIQQRKEKL